MWIIQKDGEFLQKDGSWSPSYKGANFYESDKLAYAELANLEEEGLDVIIFFGTLRDEGRIMSKDERTERKSYRRAKYAYLPFIHEYDNIHDQPFTSTHLVMKGQHICGIVGKDEDGRPKFIPYECLFHDEDDE